MTPYRFGIATPGDLKPAPKNARFMRRETFARLTENIRQDGNLSSLPFCWWDGAQYWILSGHHRVDAARAAGIEHVLFLYTDRGLTSSERAAIQLSHNALVGEDNLATLRELYEAIDSFDGKRYSGVDDITLRRFVEVSPSTFQDAGLEFEEVVLLFMPHEIERVDEVVAKLREYSGMAVYAADMADWERFWETLLRFKEVRNIQNSATAILAMVDLVSEWMEKDSGDVGEAG
jgi:hypothetical protein